MAKFLVLDASSETNDKTGETYHTLKCFGEVSKFGKTTKDSIGIRLNSGDDVQRFKPLVGKEVELDIVLPHQDYSYSLR